MRVISGTLAPYLATRQGVAFEALLWIVARDRGTGAAVPLGLWTGIDARSFTIGGVSRAYTGAGTLLDFDPVVSGAGMAVRMWTARLSGLTDEVRAALRTYDPRLAQAELHRAAFALDTGLLLEEPQRLWRGTLDTIAWPDPEQGAGAPVEVTFASPARMATTGITARKSDESQKNRSGDRGRRWADVAGEVTYWWGMKRERVKGANGGGPGGGSGGVGVRPGSRDR